MSSSSELRAERRRRKILEKAEMRMKLITGNDNDDDDNDDKVEPVDDEVIVPDPPLELLSDVLRERDQKREKNKGTANWMEQQQPGEEEATMRLLQQMINDNSNNTGEGRNNIFSAFAAQQQQQQQQQQPVVVPTFHWLAFGVLMRLSLAFFSDSLPAFALAALAMATVYTFKVNFKRPDPQTQTAEQSPSLWHLGLQLAGISPRVTSSLSSAHRAFNFFSGATAMFSFSFVMTHMAVKWMWE